MVKSYIHLDRYSHPTSDYLLLKSVRKKCVKNKIELTEQGICTMDEETNFSEATQCLVPYLQIQHPIIVDQFNVCEIVKRNELPTLKVRMLQYLCEQLRVATSSESRHLQ